MKSIFVIFAVAFGFINVFAQSRSDLDKLIETEKSFAALSGAKGIKSSFLAYLADDSVVFAPSAVNGREHYGARPDDSPATLSWYPVFADISENGALGYTTGRGEYRTKGNAADTKIYYSEYATVWRRQADGNYKVALDIGISHDKPSSDDRTVASPVRTEKFARERIGESV